MISLTAPSAPGTYYYGSCVDSVPDEDDTTNNCSPVVTVTVGAAPAPDLVVNVPTVSESAPAVGARFTLSATVRNQGAARSNSTTLRYYQSTDSTITTGDTEVGTDSVSGLDASRSGDGLISLTAPSAPGTYYYGSCVDSVPDEDDTTNNCSPVVTVTVGAAPAPDLVVNVPTVSESAPAPGATLTLSATVRNQGNGPSALTTLRYYQSDDSTITTGDTEVGTDSVSGLDASESGDGSISLTAPSAPGTYYYGSCVDSVPDEDDTTNNCSPVVTVTVGAAPAPDLVVNVPTVSQSAPAPGATLTLSASVRNQGNGPSAFTTLRYYQSDDSTITTGDTEVGTDSVSGLDASQSGDESISLTAPSDPGTYYYGACVDAVSDESDTQNNCSLAVTVTVGAAPAPDLVVDAPTVDTNAPAAEARITLSATVRNQGSGPSAFTTLRYYQSDDSTITTGDTEVGTDSVSSLDASESGDESVSLTAPATTGTYYYGACVDAVSDESDTQNNCSAAVTVTVRAAPDNPANQRFSWQASTIVVSWDQVAGAEYYNIYYDDFYDSSCRLVFGRPNLCEELAANVVGTSYTHTDPDADANYYWITACNNTGCSDIDSGNPARLEGSAPAPDLVMDAPTVSESDPAAGARFTLSATVRNQGNGPADSTTLRYYQSTDPTVTTGDAEVGTDSVSSLDASGSEDESISLTAPSTPGAYYYGACVEALSDESDTTNNCSTAVTVTVGAAPAPDLVVDTPTVSESAPAAGARFTLSATVRNQGSGPADSTTLRYYQSSDATITTGDTEIDSDYVSRLDASESGDESISLTAPDSPGTYYLGACVDAVPGELDTTNNCSAGVQVTVGAAPAPDLVVDTPTVSESAPAARARFTLSTTVRNQGNGSSAFTTLRYYQSTDATITTVDTEVGTDSVFRLNAAGSGDEWISLTAPSTLGTYYYGACVDAVSDESDTQNNCSPAVTMTVGAAPAPDLVVDTPTVSESAPAAGARFTLSATIRNQGNGPSAFTTLRYYQSTDSTITTGDTEVGTDSVSRLNAAGSGDESVSLTAPSTPGTYYYGACVEVVSGESDTQNNCSPAVTMTVGAGPAPDLVVDAPTVDTSAPVAGARFTLNATVRNQGSGPADTTTLRYYQSTDSTITTGDTEVGTDSVFRLNAAGSGDESISLTAPSDPGTYYYGACVEGVSGESDTTNNCSLAVTVSVGAAPAPDLVVDAPTVSESAPAAGARFTLSATVRNQGNGPSAFTTLRYYQSIDTTITTDDTEVGTDSVSRLNASQGGDESVSLTAPSTPGTYYYGACVDAVSDESDMTNNCSLAVTVTVGAAPAPDLVVDTPTVSESAPAAGARFTLNATVRNQGSGPADSTTLRYYQSSDPTVTTGDAEVGTDSVFRLNAAGSGDESVSLTAPSTPGTYYYGACVEGVSGESDMTNNCSLAVTVTVGAAPAPDLVVDTPTVSESAPAAGARFTLNATVRNQGSGPADSTTLRYYQSTDPTITTGDTEVDTDSVFRLDAAEIGDESISLDAPSTPGTYYYGACVDAVSDESDTTNNCSLAVTVTVGAAPAPDLVVDTPAVDTGDPAAGARFTLSATVRNQGNGSSAFTTLRYYQSTDSTINADDTEVGTDSVSSLDASESGDEWISLTAPSTPGTYYYAACVDEVSGELDTTNNCSLAVTLTVGAAPAPDLVVDTPTVSESSPAAGASFTLSATVRNQGAARSDSTMLRYYQSTDSTITADDTEVGTDSVFGLAASRSRDESISLTAPSTPGTYYYGACVDSVSDESDTTNNCSAAVTVTVGAAPAPDLVVDMPTVSESAPAAGASFTLSATVRNQGNGISDSTTLRYYQSTDPTITAGDTEVGTDSVSDLGASGSGDESISLPAPSEQGTYYYGACVDAVSDESDTTNNCSAAVQAAVSTTTGGNRYNVGDALPGVPTSGTFIPAVSSGVSLQSSGGNTTITFDNGGYIELQDGTRYTCESSGGCEVVNGEVTRGTIAGQTTASSSSPDLVVDAPTVSESAPVAGASFTLSAAVRNQGAARSDSTTLRYYQSTDSTITTGDSEVGTDSVFRLDASGSGDESISLTAPSTPGTYHYGACVDEVSGESDTTNNCSTSVTVVVGAAPAPDLVVDTPTVDTSTPAAGDRFLLRATVRNQGNGPSAFTSLRYYQSSDSTITTGDTEVGTNSVSRYDAAEGGEEWSYLDAPPIPGTYYFGACVDAVTGESDTTNNCSTAVTITVRPGSTPDLVVDTPTVSQSAPPAGTSFTLNATVRNRGNRASASTWLRFYHSSDATITSSDTLVSTNIYVDGLNPSGSSAKWANLTAPSTAGTYYYGACVDSVRSESDTTNNCSVAVTVVVGAAPAPDLVVDTLTVSDSSPTAGASFTLSARVHNQGSGQSASTTLRYYRSTDSTITTGDTSVDTDSIPKISPSWSSPQSISMTVPSTPGTYYYGACVDTVTGESDTANNCSVAVTVVVNAAPAPAPDLVIDTPTVSDSSPTAGAFFTLNATVRNRGNGPSATTALYYWRATVTESSVGGFREVGTDTVDTLAASGASNMSISLTAPATPGMYDFFVGVNPVPGESNTNNNYSDLVRITVQSAPGAPTGLTATADGPTEIDLSWTAPSDDGGTDITGYRIEVSTNGSSWSDLVANTNSTATSYSHTGLTAWSTRHYRVSAINSAGTGTASNTANATTGAAPGPDLVVDTPTVADIHPIVGTFFSLYATVRNQGADASGPATLLFYRSTDSTITTSDERIGAGSKISGLSPTETDYLGDQSRAPSTPGTYYYGACVVSSKDESNTANNCSPALTIIPGGQPDLVVKTPWISHSNATAASIMDLHAVVRNEGTGHLPEYAAFDVFLSTDSTDTKVGGYLWWPMDISSGSEEGLTVSFRAPSTAGEYYYYACVEVVREESDTTNNCSAAVKVTVRPPDLTILLPTVSSYSTTAGESFTLNVTVLNQGDVRSADFSATIRYYRSTDATITSADTSVGTNRVIVPNAHVTSDKSISLTAPSRAGTYYYGACVDTIADESSSANNCSEAVEVTVGPRPLSLRLTSCFVFHEQHFVMFEVRTRIPLSSVVVHTYQVEGRNNKLHLMETTNVGNLAAGSSYSKLTSRYFPAHLRRHLTTCTASLEWDDGTAAPGFTPDLTTVPDLPPPPPTYAPPAYEPSRIPTKRQVYHLFSQTLRTNYGSCGFAGLPPCPGRDYIAWWLAQAPKIQRCAFIHCSFD